METNWQGIINELAIQMGNLSIERAAARSESLMLQKELQEKDRLIQSLKMELAGRANEDV